MKLQRRRQLAFVEDFARWLDDGHSPSNACQAMVLHARQHQLRAEQRLGQALLQTLSRGQPLVTALQDHIDRDLCMIFAVGERAGCLHPLLLDYQQLDKHRRDAYRAFIRPLVYPVSMAMLALLGCYLIGQRVVPSLVGQLDAGALPAATAWLLLVSTPVTIVGVMMSLGLTVLVVWGPLWLPGQSSAMGRRLSRYGAFRIGQGFAAVVLLQLLNLLLRHGYNLDQAARLLNTAAPGWLRNHLRMVRERLARGERQLASLLDTGLLTSRMLFRLSNGRSGVQREQDVDNLARAAQRATDDATLTLARSRLLLLVLCYVLIAALMLLLLGGMGGLMMVLAQSTL